MAFSFSSAAGLLKRRTVFIPLILLAAGVGGWRWYASAHAATSVSYVTGTAQRATLKVAAKGSGQISSTNQVDLKAKASGTVVAVAAKEGQAVKAGDVIVRLDASDAARAVRDAESSLETAQLSLQKLQAPTDALSLMQTQNALTQATQNKANAQDDLAKVYDDGYNAVASAFLSLPDVMAGLDGVMNGKTSDTGQNFIDAYGDAADSTDAATIAFKAKAVASYAAARQAYDANFNGYKASSRYASPADMETLLNETYATVKSIAESVKDAKNFLDYANDVLTKKNRQIPSALTAQRTSLQAYTGTTNGQLGSLLSAVNAITNGKQAIVNDGRAIEEKTVSLAKLQAGADPLDVRSQQLSIEQRRNALADAQRALSDYAVRAPFDGVVTKILARVGDQASGTLATLLSPTLIAGVSLNEIDVVNVKAGQSAALTFDALPNVKASGTVSEVDTLGTTSQGVVTYAVKIALDKADPRVKPGMNVSAAITTAQVDGAIVVPSSAVRTGRNGSAVQVMGSDGKPQPRPVEVGLANDTQTELTSGLDEGETYVVRTVVPTTGAAATARTGTSAIPGLGGAGGGNFQFRGGAGGATGGFRTGG